jgi:hypothetical protein
VRDVLLFFAGIDIFRDTKCLFDFWGGWHWVIGVDGSKLEEG